MVNRCSPLACRCSKGDEYAMETLLELGASPDVGAASAADLVPHLESPDLVALLLQRSSPPSCQRTCTAAC
jgi:hypothetical protein